MSSTWRYPWNDFAPEFLETMCVCVCGCGRGVLCLCFSLQSAVWGLKFIANQIKIVSATLGFCFASATPDHLIGPCFAHGPTPSRHVNSNMPPWYPFCSIPFSPKEAVAFPMRANSPAYNFFRNSDLSDPRDESLEINTAPCPMPSSTSGPSRVRPPSNHKSSRKKLIEQIIFSETSPNDATVPLPFVLVFAI